MKLPKLENPEKYRGLYIFDFGDHAGVGFTAEEVAELLDSERYRDGKVYKIHRAYPDGRLELKGVPAGRFQMETAMLFHSADVSTGRGDFKRLVDLAVRSLPPCRAKVHLARYSDDRFAVVVIYPAEYNDEFSDWLLAGDYRTNGQVEGGLGVVEQYYQDQPEILERHQLFGSAENISRTGEELLASLRQAVLR
jgi:hypothetical protein